MGWHKLPILKILSEKIERNNLNIAINVLYAKREELKEGCILLMFQSTIQFVKKKLLF